MSDNFHDVSIDPEPVEDRSEFIRAVREQAFDAGKPCPTCNGDGTVRPGRRVVHCFGSFTGADWDEDGVVRAIEDALSVEWMERGDHQLAVLDRDGMKWRFQVQRSEVDQ